MKNGLWSVMAEKITKEFPDYDITKCRECGCEMVVLSEEFDPLYPVCDRPECVYGFLHNNK